jgi:hypothetical protein
VHSRTIDLRYVDASQAPIREVCNQLAPATSRGHDAPLTSVRSRLNQLSTSLSLALDNNVEQPDVEVEETVRATAESNESHLDLSLRSLRHGNVALSQPTDGLYSEAKSMNDFICRLYKLSSDA